MVYFDDCDSPSEVIHIVPRSRSSSRRRDTMPPVKIERERKRPTCQTCGNLMAGHKRKGGIVVCPPKPSVKLPPVGTFPPIVVEETVEILPSVFETTNTDEPTLVDEPVFVGEPGPIAGPSNANIPLRRETAIPVLESPRSSKARRYINPNWEEPPIQPLPYVPRPRRGSGTPDSWVSTEPADDIPSSHVKLEQPLDIIHESDEIQFMMVRGPSQTPSASSAGSSGSTTMRLRRSFTNILRTSVPILSMFSAQREDVSTITRTARQNGLHTGVMRPPDSPIEVKDEDDFSHTPREKKSLWVIVGKDPVAVERLLDLQERDELARIASPSPPSIPRQVAATPSLQIDKPHQFSTAGLISLVFFIAIVVNAMGIFGLSML